MAAKEKKIHIAPEEGVYLPTLQVMHKVTAENFSPALAIVEASIPPGEMIPPHTHAWEDECAFVLEGELTLDVGGEIVVATVGSFVLKPRGIYHAVCNTGTEPVRFLEFHTPGKFENYYDEYEQIVQSVMNEPERRKARAALGERYGITWHEERIPEAMARFGIKP
jgi:quercetin dioxygenase-like cupin family protein